GLYVTILVLSGALLAAAWSMLVAEYRLYAIPGCAIAAALALAGWQPVVAGLRQGDAVLAAASLVVIGWGLLRRDRPLAAGIVVGTAAVLSLPAAVCILALARWP